MPPSGVPPPLPVPPPDALLVAPPPLPLPPLPPLALLVAPLLVPMPVPPPELLDEPLAPPLPEPDSPLAASPAPASSAAVLNAAPPHAARAKAAEQRMARLRERGMVHQSTIAPAPLRGWRLVARTRRSGRRARCSLDGQPTQPQGGRRMTLAHYEQEGATAVVRMDDGKVNALSEAMIEELGAALVRAEGSARA